MNKTEVDKLKNELKDFILMMLGAPINTVPLDTEQIDTCINYAFQSLEDSTGEKISEDFQLDDEATNLLQIASLAYAKITLGRKSQQFKEPCVFKLEGKTLLKEGLKEKEYFHEKIIDYIPSYKIKNSEISPHETNKEATGILVFYVNVGNLPAFKAEAFIDRLRDKFKLQEIKKMYEVIYIPVRDQETRVEFISFK